MHLRGALAQAGVERGHQRVRCRPPSRHVHDHERVHAPGGLPRAHRARRSRHRGQEEVHGGMHASVGVDSGSDAPRGREHSCRGAFSSSRRWSVVGAFPGVFFFVLCMRDDAPVPVGGVDEEHSVGRHLLQRERGGAAVEHVVVLLDEIAELIERAPRDVAIGDGSVDLAPGSNVRRVGRDGCRGDFVVVVVVVVVVVGGDVVVVDGGEGCFRCFVVVVGGIIRVRVIRRVVGGDRRQTPPVIRRGRPRRRVHPRRRAARRPSRGRRVARWTPSARDARRGDRPEVPIPPRVDRAQRREARPDARRRVPRDRTRRATRADREERPERSSHRPHLLVVRSVP